MSGKSGRVLLAAGCWLSASIVFAQEAQEERSLEERMATLERRNRELEERLVEMDLGLDEEEMLEETLNTGLFFKYGDVYANFQIYGDGGFDYSNSRPAGEGNSIFSNGAISLLLNTQFGDHIRVLSESVVELESSEELEFSQERLWASWTVDDSVYFKLGTEHSSISRYNQLYHHGRYLETAASRPLVAAFEGGEGILPLHRTGLQAGGRRIGEKASLEYFAAVSNGRGAEPTDKQGASDANDSKAIDIGVAYEPAGDSELRFGIAAVFDEIPPDPDSTDPLRARSMQEWIGTFHAEGRFGAIAFLGEFAYIHHEARADDSDYSSHAAYLQAEFQKKPDWTPYARFDYRDMSGGDPFYAPLDRDLDAWGPLLGVRHDPTNNVALKVEAGYRREDQRDGAGSISEQDVFTIAVQVSWWL